MECQKRTTPGYTTAERFSSTSEYTGITLPRNIPVYPNIPCENTVYLAQFPDITGKNTVYPDMSRGLQ